MFNVPGEVAHDMTMSGTSLKTLSPKMARAWLKKGVRREELSRSLAGNVGLCIEILKFCLLDGRVGEADRREAWNELKGLFLLPMSDGSLGEVGASRGIWGRVGQGRKNVIASKEQQRLLPGMGGSFLHLSCVEALSEWMGNEEFLECMQIITFDNQFLSENVGSVLPKAWHRKDFVPYEHLCEGSDVVAGGAESGPNALWLKLFWKQVNICDFESVALFSEWPLIPCVSGELASCSNARFILGVWSRSGDARLQRSLGIEFQRVLEEIEDEELRERGGEEEVMVVEEGGGEEEFDWKDVFVHDDEVEEGEDSESGEEEEDSESGEEEEEAKIDSEREVEREGESLEDDLAPPPLEGLPQAVLVEEGGERRDEGEGMPLPPPPPGPSAAESAQEQQQQQQQLSQLQDSSAVRQLFELLKKLRAPLLELAYFSSMDVESLLMKTPGRDSMAKKIITTLSQAANYWVSYSGGEGARLLWSEMQGSESDQLLKSLVFDEQGGRLDLMSSDLDKLKQLRLFETVGEEWASIEGGGNFTLGAELSWEECREFLPASAKSKFLKEKEIGDVLKDLGVEALTESKLLLKFVLPEFGEMPRIQKERFLERVLAKWALLKEDTAFVTSMKQAAIVLRGGRSRGEEYVACKELLDPKHELLFVVFEGDLRQFPDESYSSEEWLGIWRELGLQTTVDKATFLVCAKSVEREGSVHKGEKLLRYVHHTHHAHHTHHTHTPLAQNL